MAEVDSNLRTFLLAQASVTAIFSTRIYVDKISVKAVYPYAIIKTVTESPGYAHDGALPDTSLMQIDVRSTAKSTASSGAAAIKAVLSGYSGAISGITAGSVFITNSIPRYDPDERVFIRTIDALISQNG